MGGDWKQLLPVTLRSSEEDAIQATLRFSPLWPHFQIHTLTQNMRADPEHLAFAQWLEQVGAGQLQHMDQQHGNHEFIKVPPAMWVQTDIAVIDWLYDPDTLASPERMSEVALLTVKNNMTMVLNARIMSMLPSTPILLIGTNKILVDEDAAPNIPVMQPEAVFDHLQNGFPPTQLLLRKGTIVMLLRNIDVSAGLCNGTRLVVKAFANNRILHCGRIGADAEMQDVLLPRIDFVFHSPDGMVNFHRRQFPVRVAFLMTINKSQGQTFRKVGIVLYEPVFALGHLYVALSCATNTQSIRIVTPSNKAVARLTGFKDIYIRNVVYKSVL